MKHALLILVISTFFPNTAAAQAAYFHQRGNWTVFNTSEHCVATSRPTVETNFSPYMVLNLLHEIDSKEIHVAAYLWPNAFTEGEQIVLGLRSLSGASQVELPATALHHYAVKTDRALTRDELRTLGENDALIVMAEGPPKQMAVEVEFGLQNIIRILRSCGQFATGK